MLLPTVLRQKIEQRKKDNALRVLSSEKDGIDFYSNDYLGFASNKTIAKRAQEILKKEKFCNGSTGSRLISGTHTLHTQAESFIADYHRAESALLYNSGYDANLGLFSSLLQKNDIVLFDELIHASVRDGIRLGISKTYKFKHNCLQDLEKKILKFKTQCQNLYISIETIYSMDGDEAPLQEIVDLCDRYGVYLIVDEAHSTGVIGEGGRGLVCDLGLETKIFARVHTFGKAMGCHGAVVLGSESLREYLINFSRSFIYSTALSLHSVAVIMASYQYLSKGKELIELKNNINYFNDKIKELGLSSFFIESSGPIHCCVISGNSKVKKIALELQSNGLLVKPILSPTVASGQERLRICISSKNKQKDVCFVLKKILSILD